MMKWNFKTACILCVFLMIGIISCVKNESREPLVVDPCAGSPGPLFLAAKSLIVTKCLGCHNATTARGGVNFSVDCNIVASKDRIKVRAVDQGTMPPSGPLPQADKNTITNWINAGGKYSD